MNKILIYILTLFILSNCSFNKNSKIWKKKELQLENKENVKIILADKEVNITELNPYIKINLSNINFISNDNYNNFGFQSYSGEFENNGSYKFSKHKDNKFLDTSPSFLNNGLIYYDGKGSIIRFDDQKKTIWKKNYYTKPEIKRSPKLNFFIRNDLLIVVDNISKIYLIDAKNGNLIWKKNNEYPFNSEIKVFEDRFFVVDYLNTLRCFYIKDGSNCWTVETEESFTISDTKYSIVIVEDKIIFNNSIGDITAVDISSGSIIWQTPTQSSKIKSEAYSFKVSQLVTDKKSIFFSNNKNEFYSLDVKTGTLNWLNKINSDITPILYNNYIFTFSNDGYFYVLQKNQGNIIRINHIFKYYKVKNRKKIKPIGFSIGKNDLYLSNNDGKLMIIDLKTAQLKNIENISRISISKPIIKNKKLYIVKAGSILEYN